ncbi:C39 family peptidase [Sulfuriflexus mobilis]|uniref:C39 family peptidase n=1 Tax=Sulfuriflexus mobilis TaxID=1811807 RepID=UPI0018D53D01|nr:C39 family peptidase [Sulfuriflexus mobilis]
MKNDNDRITYCLMRYVSALSLMLLLFMSSMTGASEVRFGSILPGAGVINKQVISLREQRYVNLVRQDTDFSCGAAALATILKYAYGRDVTEESVLRGMLKVSDPETVRKRGFSLLDIKRYTQSIGLRGRGYKVKSGTLSRIKIPIIALVDIRGYKHFVVFKTYRDGKVYIADPALGNKILSFEEFNKIWNGVVFAVIGKGFDRNTVLMQPAAPVTARGLARAHIPLTNNDLLKFGFTHAELF